MYLRYYIGENGQRVYTLKTEDPNGNPTHSAHPEDMAESVSVSASCDNNNVQPSFLSDVKRPNAAEIPSNIRVTSEGKNGQQIKCQRCPSTILLPEMATLVTAEFNLPAMGKSNESEQNEDSKQFWCADNMYAFENVGFSKTVDGVKYLICADCEIGPIGWYDLNTKLSYVSLCRIDYC